MTQGTPVDNPEAAVGDERTSSRVPRTRQYGRPGRDARPSDPMYTSRTRTLWGAAPPDESPR